MSEGRTHNVVRNSIWGILNKITTILLPFVVRTILINILGNECVGLNSLFTTIFNVLNLVEAGFSSAIVYSMYKPIASHDDQTLSALLKYYKNIYRLVGSTILAGGIAMIPFLRTIVKDDVQSDVNIYILYGICLFNTTITYFFYGYKASLFNAYQRLDIYSKILTVSALCQYIFQIVGLMITKNYYAYAMAQSIVIIPQCYVVNYVANRCYPTIIPHGEISNEIKRGILTRVCALLGHKIGGTVIFSVDNIIISSILGLELLGKYGNYFMFVTAIVNMTSMILQGSIASIGNKAEVEGKKTQKTLFLNLTFVWNWIVSWASICLLCLFQPAISIWIGNSNLLPTRFVVIMALYYYAWQFRAMALNFKDAYGLWKDDWIKPYIGMIINFVLSLVLVKLFKDLIWVMIPTIIVMALIYFPFETYVLFKKVFFYSPKLYIKKTLKYLLCTVCIGGVSFYLISFIRFDGIIGLFLKLLFCIIVPNLLFPICYFRDSGMGYLSGVIDYFGRKILRR